MISVVSYGSGNIAAIANIFHRSGVEFNIAKNQGDLEQATKLVLPGVGAFDHTMGLLEKSGMIPALNRLVLDDKVPVLGICVGMQVMANASQEGERKGLGWIDASIRRFEVSKMLHKPFIPHLGWNLIKPRVEHSLFRSIDMEKGFYFLHSYYFSTRDPAVVMATTDYGIEFASAVNSENIYGLQFHPEKSHANGMRIFQNFADL